MTLYPDPASLEGGTFEVHSAITRDKPVPCQIDRERGAAAVWDFTGTLYVGW